MNEIVYYLILDCLVGKKEDAKYYLFREDKWVPDTGYMISLNLLQLTLHTVKHSKAVRIIIPCSRYPGPSPLIILDSIDSPPLSTAYISHDPGNTAVLYPYHVI